MKRKEFLKKSIIGFSALGMMSSLKAFADSLPVQSKRMPVLFTSHGHPGEIPKTKEESPFWNALHVLGKELRADYEVKAMLVVSAHWCSRGTFVNISSQQEQIYDYYGFPKEYYDPKYHALGAPSIAKEVARIVPTVKETTDWGLDHGAWPMLMHLFPEANVPVFQMSIDYYAKPDYHFNLGQQLASLRDKGVLIIGSGALIHNLKLGMQKFRKNDFTPFGWEAEYDAWLKQQIDARNFKDLINYTNSHKLGKLASPTPDHYVPVLYSLGLATSKDSLRYFYEGDHQSPAFSERSFILSEMG